VSFNCSTVTMQVALEFRSHTLSARPVHLEKQMQLRTHPLHTCQQGHNYLQD
jgi:hypothetical protein